MKFLIDKCLSPDLTQLAWDAGFEGAHVARIGRHGAKDWQHVQHAIDGDWVLVDITCRVIETVTANGIQFPGSESPGEPAWPSQPEQT